MNAVPKTMETESHLDVATSAPRTSIVFALLGMLVCGVLYPAIATLAGGALFPAQAQGSLIRIGGVVIGSSLIAQPFSAPQYFQARPSAASFNPTAASGSNFGPSNPALRERMAATSAEISTREKHDAATIPADLISASGSGLDPHISPAAAYFQADRVAAARGLSLAQVRAQIDRHTEAPSLGVFGQARVNVLLLNLSLDQAE